MNKVVKLILISFFAFLIFINNTYASSGALKKASIKTCPNGKTYGYHGSDKHWHEAMSSNTSSGWTAIGEALLSDPCPNDVVKNVPKNNSNENSNKTNNNVIEGKKEEEKNNIIDNNLEENNAIVKEEEKDIKKSSNTSISSLIINGEHIEVNDTIYYEINLNNVIIDVKLEDMYATYEIIGETTNLKNNKINEITIKVVAEDGSIKNYYLEIKAKYEKKDFINDYVEQEKINNFQQETNESDSDDLASSILGLITIGGEVMLHINS